jgi:hypothetical protein
MYKEDGAQTVVASSPEVAKRLAARGYLTKTQQDQQLQVKATPQKNNWLATTAPDGQRLMTPVPDDIGYGERPPMSSGFPENDPMSKALKVLNQGLAKLAVSVRSQDAAAKNPLLADEEIYARDTRLQTAKGLLLADKESYAKDARLQASSRSDSLHPKNSALALPTPNAPSSQMVPLTFEDRPERILEALPSDLGAAASRIVGQQDEAWADIATGPDPWRGYSSSSPPSRGRK